LRLFRQLTRAEPANALWWIKLAEAQYRAQDYERALNAAESCWRCRPSMPTAWLWKGAALSALGRRKEGIEALQGGTGARLR
jgi:predicted Zn-dependent protease